MFGILQFDFHLGGTCPINQSIISVTLGQCTSGLHAQITPSIQFCMVIFHSVSNIDFLCLPDVYLWCVPRLSLLSVCSDY